MRRRCLGTTAILLALLAATPAHALIVRLIPLRDVLAEQQFIVVARVDSVDPNRPAAVFVVEEDLKGKFPFRRLPVNLTGDAEAKKLDHTPQLLKRLAPKVPLVLFFTQNEARYNAFAYTNGTWFQMVAEKPRDSDRLVWAFAHCEPYLRRTFKGTTEELRQVVIDGLSGKRKPPEPNPKEPPGFGPEVKSAEKRGLRIEQDNEHAAPASAALYPQSSNGPPFAVIPTIGIGGPLAILALLFPTVFGGVLVLFKRWLAFFTVFSVNTLIYFLHLWFAADFVGSWWATPAGLWFMMTVATFLGTLWAWLRHVRTVTGDEVIEAPRRTESVVLWILSLACAATVLIAYFNAPAGNEVWWNALLALSAGIWAATLYNLCRTLFAAPAAMPAPAAPTAVPVRRVIRPALPTEGVMLWVILFAFVGFAAARPGQATVSASADAAGEGRPTAKLVKDGGWMKVFDEHGPGMVLSSPVIAGERLYIAAAHGALNRRGVLYCLDLNTRQVVWSFTNNGQMKQVFCTPCVDGDRVYIGEGFHEDKGCNLYCLDARTGTMHWAFPTGSHTESRPVVVKGKVYFGAGDDGVYCVDALKGMKVWQFPDGERARTLHLHVDSAPAVVDGRVYVGGGIDEDTTHGDPAVACLDADTGKEIWVRRTPEWMVLKGEPQGRKFSLPAWGAPVVDRGQVFFGLGNGRITDSSATFEPAGALLAVDAATGNDLWPPFPVGDGVLNRPALDGQHVYFGSRDGFCYCVGRDDGKLRWKKALGSAVVATPALDHCTSCGHTASVFALGSGGQVFCLDPSTGKVHWSHTDLQESQPTLCSTPAVVVTHTAQGDRRRIYFGAALNNLSIPALYCLEDLLPAR
jgi:outer membrane protein assembly factor BamB